MALETKGFDDLFNTLDILGNVGDKVGKNAVKAGAEVGLPYLKKYAPKDSGDSAKKLRITSTKKFKNDWWTQMGIDDKNWEQCKGLWFQHWGFTHWKNGEKISKHVGWMDKAYKKAENEMGSVMIKALESELDKVLK